MFLVDELITAVSLALGVGLALALAVLCAEAVLSFVPNTCDRDSDPQTDP